MKFVHFAAPDGTLVSINPEQVLSFRPNDGSYDSRAKTVIVLMAGFQAVRETPSEVEERLG